MDKVEKEKLEFEKMKKEEYIYYLFSQNFTKKTRKKKIIILFLIKYIIFIIKSLKKN